MFSNVQIYKGFLKFVYIYIYIYIIYIYILSSLLLILSLLLISFVIFLFIYFSVFDGWIYRQKESSTRLEFIKTSEDIDKDFKKHHFFVSHQWLRSSRSHSLLHRIIIHLQAIRMPQYSRYSVRDFISKTKLTSLQRHVHTYTHTHTHTQTHTQNIYIYIYIYIWGLFQKFWASSKKNSRSWVFLLQQHTTTGKTKKKKN